MALSNLSQQQLHETFSVIVLSLRLEGAEPSEQKLSKETLSRSWCCCSWYLAVGGEKQQPGTQVGSYSNVDVGGDVGNTWGKIRERLGQKACSSSPSLYLGLLKCPGLLLSPVSHNKQMQNG